MHAAKLISSSILVLAGALQTIAASFCIQHDPAESLLWSGGVLMAIGMFTWLWSLKPGPGKEPPSP